MIHKAKDLSPEQKVAIESLLGRHVLDDDAISVRVIEPPPLPSPITRSMNWRSS